MKIPLTSALVAILAIAGLSPAFAEEKAVADDPRTRIAPDNPNLAVRSDFRNLRIAGEEGEKKAHVAFLGGSITQNTGGHTAMVPAWLEAEFPETEFTFTNAGLGSTCSTSGAFRLGTHVLAKGPVDLFIVEFAVNDDQDAVHARRECIRGMEGVVRQIRRYHPRCEIVMIHYVNPEMLEKTQNGRTPVSIAAHESVAKHYGVTSVNVAAEVADAIGAGRYAWADYGGTHPKKFGYRVASNMVIAAVEAGLAEPDGGGDGGSPVDYPLPDPMDAFSYDGGVFLHPGEPIRSKGWRIAPVSKDVLPVGAIREQYEEYEVLRGDSAGETLTLDFHGRAVGAFILAGPDAGIVETSVDGGEFVEHELFHRFSSKLNYPRSVIFHSGLEEGKHRLELRISGKKNPASTGHAVSILFFEVNAPVK